jgi:lysophospholipase
MSENYQTQILERMAWYLDHFIEDYLSSVSGCRLRLAFQPRSGADQALLVVSGRAEYIEKYIELAEDLQQTGLALCIYDHCGQGGSGRLLEDENKGHIDRFQTYVEDLNQVITWLRTRHGIKTCHLLSHSMGGTVSALQAASWPETVGKVVLGSPMFGINSGVMLPTALLRLFVAATVRLGAGTRSIYRSGTVRAEQRVADNIWTSDKNRFEFNSELAASLKHAVLKEPTYRWVDEAYRATDQVKRQTAKIRSPVLLLAASDDRIVGLQEMRDFVRACPDCTYREYRDARHELYMECNQIRERLISEVTAFLAK